VFNMFRTLIYPSSGDCDYSVELPHWSYCSWFRCVLEFRCGWVGVISVLQVEACNTDITPTQPHRNSNTQRTENKTTDVVTQQHSRKLLMMDILMSETCWVHKKWNKIASDIKLVSYSSTRATCFPNAYECKRLGFHSPFLNILGKDLFPYRSWRWHYKNRNMLP